MTDLASRWRALAEEIFARADRVHDADIRDKIRRIAAGYERLAQRVEDQSAEGQCGVSHVGRRTLARHILTVTPPQTVAARRAALWARCFSALIPG
jgi:hypothetical protein